MGYGGGGFKPRQDRGGSHSDYGGYGGPRESIAPVNVGDELDVTIEAVGEKGDGIAKKNGFVLFVPSTKQGERIRIRVTKVLRKVGFAEKIGEAQSAASEAPRASSERRPAETAEASEPAPEDTENFGEEQQEQQ